MHFNLQKQGQLVAVHADSGIGNLGRPSVVGVGEGARLAGRESLFEFWLDTQEDPGARLEEFRDRIAYHPTVAACLQMRRENVVAMDEEIVPALHPVNPEGAKRLAEYVAKVWSEIPSDIRMQTVSEMQNAVLEGGQGHEWDWHREVTGEERPVKSNPVHRSRFRFDRLDNMALLTRSNPIWGAYVQQNAVAIPDASDHVMLRNLPTGKFTYHVYQRGQGTWSKPTDEAWAVYGIGLNVSLEAPVMRHLSAWVGQDIWLAQYGRPPRILYCPDNSADWSTWASQIARDLLTKQIVAVPSRFSGATGNQKMFEVDQPGVPSPSFDAFGSSMDRSERFVKTIMLHSDAVMDNEGKGGGYASHESHKEGGPDVLARSDSAKISGTFNRYMIPAIVKYGPDEFRKAPVSDYPRHTMTRTQKDEPKELVELYKEASSLGIKLSKKEFLERTGFKEATSEEDTLKPLGDPMQDMIDGGDPAGGGQQHPGDRLKAPIGQGEDNG